jgi:hypothetical protein
MHCIISQNLLVGVVKSKQHGSLSATAVVAECCKTAISPPDWECFIEEFAHSHGEMSSASVF